MIIAICNQECIVADYTFSQHKITIETRRYKLNNVPTLWIQNYRLVDADSSDPEQSKTLHISNDIPSVDEAVFNTIPLGKFDVDFSTELVELMMLDQFHINITPVSVVHEDDVYIMMDTKCLLNNKEIEPFLLTEQTKLLVNRQLIQVLDFLVDSGNAVGPLVTKHLIILQRIVNVMLRRAYE